MEKEKMRTTEFQTLNSSSEAIPTFLLKAYEILENDKFFDIISWTKNGEGFVVKKIHELSETVLPLYFKHSNYTSFVRQLNMYDFHKTRQQNHENAFKNPMFKKGFKHLLKKIQRKDYKKNKEKQNFKEPIESQNNELSVDVYKLFDQIGLINFSKLIQINTVLQKKALLLAQVRQVPRKQTDLLKLIDLLFDTNKYQKRMMVEIQMLFKDHLTKKTNCSQPLQNIPQKGEYKFQQFSRAQKLQFQSMKDDRLATHSTLLSSFRQC